MDNAVRTYLAAIGRKGGQRSRRELSSEDARNMVRVREARRAFRDFYARCFWSFDPNLHVTLRDVPWVIEQLQKHGGRAAWQRSLLMR